MLRGKFGQAKCSTAGCNSWHFAINLDEMGNVVEAKCCRCRTIFKIDPAKRMGLQP